MVSLKNSLCIACILIGLAHCGITPSLQAAPPPTESPATAGIYSECQIDPTADSNFSLALFRLWFPSDKPVQGILAVLPGSDTHGTPMADDPHWQALATKWNYGLLGITFTTRGGAEPYYQAEKGSGEALLSALKRSADESEHSELKDAPIAILGHSQGGGFAFHFACWQPQRTVAFATIKGGYYVAKPTDAARNVPGLLCAGELDEEFRKKNIRALFNANPESRWCFVMEPDSGHDPDRTLDLIVPFFDAIIRGKLDPLRANPDTLELAPPTATAESPGAWLPNPEVAETWLRLAKRSLPESGLKLQIADGSPPQIAEVPGTHDFGKVQDNHTPDPAVFPVFHVPNGPQWDTVRAYSLKGRVSSTATTTDGQWRIEVRPALAAGQPLGRLHDALILRFAKNGKPVPGGAEISLTMFHVHDALTISPHYLYFGTHSGSVEKSFTIRSNRDPLVIRDVKLVEGAAADLRVEKPSGTSATLTATLTSLPEEASHSGIFIITLEQPISTEIAIPFLGYFKPK
jgi:hypothetical protein